MQTHKHQFAEIINGNKQFIIPIFQRDYSWTTAQADRLWLDIVNASGTRSARHFMGSFVYVLEDVEMEFSSWLVIDGQQRLTTLILLLIALRDHITELRKALINAGDSDGANSLRPDPDSIEATLLRNVREKGDRSYRLALRRADNSTLRALVDKLPMPPGQEWSESIQEVYSHFRGLLKSFPHSPNQVYQGIGRLELVGVQLDESDNPQAVFESLNSTGVRLSQSDLVRNYLLMGLPEREQTRLYEEYWSKLEEDFRRAGSEPNSFLRDYIALKQGNSTQAREDRIYEEFKSFWTQVDKESVDSLLADMVRFARFYVSFLRPSVIPQEQLIAPMTNLRRGGFGDSHALLVMRLYDCFDRKLLTESDFARCLVLIKSYLIRRAVLGLQTRAYWGVFARIAFAINDETPLSSFQVALARRAHNYRFPDDDEFTKEIQERDLYSLRICGHVLERLENAGQKELSSTDECSIEHIMPQTVDDSKAWQSMLGKDWENVHKTWLHRLGNLTLTAYNSPMSNSSFETKKTIKGGFKDSPVRLNRFVRDQTQWTSAEMQERGRLLAVRAAEIWPFHGADTRLVRDEDIRQLQLRAAQHSVEDLEMSDYVRDLTHAVFEAIDELGGVIRVVQHKSVDCYEGSAQFFAEVLPMAYHVRIVVPLDFDEVNDSDGLAGNVNDWKFLVNVRHRDCGVFVDVREKQQVPAAMRMVRQAFDLAEE